jgi:hypothetical protein
METTTLLKYYLKSLMIFVFISFSFIVKGQTPTYSCDIKNDKFVTSKIFEFDIYLKQTGSNAFELSNFQTGVKLDPTFINGGVLSVSLVSGTTELNASQEPLFCAYDAVNNCIKVAPRTPPRNYTTGATSGTIINSTTGQRVCTVRVTNSVNFSNIPANFTWNFAVRPYNTIVAAFVPGSPKVNTIITNSASHSKSENITVFISGLFDGTGNRKVQDGNLGTDYFPGPVSDRVSVDLMQTSAPFTVVFHADNVNLYTNGKCAFNIPGSITGSYYLLVHHRNSIAVCSAAPLSFGSTINYNFSTSQLQAYQFPGGIDPMKQVAPGVFALYLGDIDQSGSVDIDDMSTLLPDVTNGTVAYVPSDVDGLGWVDIDDMSAIIPNMVDGVYAQSPEFGK